MKKTTKQVDSALSYADQMINKWVKDRERWLKCKTCCHLNQECSDECEVK